MEIWEYLEILRNKKQGWLFRKHNTDERLDALTKISQFGQPGSIQSLIPFLKDDNKEIRHSACDIIVQLFNKIETRRGYYDTFRHCDLSQYDTDFFEREFSRENFSTLLAIASLNGNGYVREAAVRRLGVTDNARSIQFIVFRLADWVPSVRQAAIVALESFKKPKFIDSLIDNLSIFQWLQKVERTDLSFVYADLMSYVVIKNRDYVVANFKRFKDKTRIIIARELCKPVDIATADLQLLANDRNFIVRNLVLKHFDKLSQREVDLLLKDKSSRVRLETLRKLKGQADLEKIMFQFLADSSASIRYFARFTLKEPTFDFAFAYRENLLNNRNIFGSLCGLSEVNATHYASIVENFLVDKRAKIRKAAFLALRKLDKAKAYQFAYDTLDSEDAGLRKLSIEYLAGTGKQEMLEKARAIFANGDIELRRSMLGLFSKIGHWATIADIMIGTIDFNESIRELSLKYLIQWKRKAANYFMLPREGELERAHQIFKFAFEMLEEKKLFKENPLVGMEFFLR